MRTSFIWTGSQVFDNTNINNRGNDSVRKYKSDKHRKQGQNQKILLQKK